VRTAVLTTTMQDTDNTKRPPPFSLRLTQEERQQLERRAAGTSLGAYIRACLFGENEANPAFKRRTRSKFPVKDHKALAHVLSQLGASRLASNLNQLAKAVNTGSLPVSPETERDLQAACRDIRAIKDMLMRALGFREH
jgi:hypothetical protein